MIIQTFIVHWGEGYFPDIPSWLKVKVTEGDYPDADYLMTLPGYNHVHVDDYETFRENNTGSMVIIEGEPDAIRSFLALYSESVSVIRGADDDTFDYWPSNIDAFEHLCEQYDEQVESKNMTAKMLWAATYSLVIARDRFINDFTEDESIDHLGQ